MARRQDKCQMRVVSSFVSSCYFMTQNVSQSRTINRVHVDFALSLEMGRDCATGHRVVIVNLSKMTQMVYVKKNELTLQ